jgi:hypothetical protein
MLEVTCNWVLGALGPACTSIVMTSVAALHQLCNEPTCAVGGCMQPW